MVTFTQPKPTPPFFYAARLEGDLCGRDNDVVLSSTWLNSSGIDTNGPHVWTDGNILIVSAEIITGGLAQCDPGVLTVTASLDGVQIGVAITLVITQV